MKLTEIKQQFEEESPPYSKRQGQQSDGEAYGEGRDERKDGVSNAHSNPGRRGPRAQEGKPPGSHSLSPRDGETVVEVEGVSKER